MKLELTSFSVNMAKVKSINLTELQKQYLDVFQKEKTIKNTVLFFLKNGWLINFNQFWQMIQLLDSQCVLSPSLKDLTPHFEKSNLVVNYNEFKKWPFFRSLPEPIVSFFWNQHKIVNVPAGTTLIKNGDQSKDLWTQISGQSAIYTKGAGHLKKVAGIIDPQATFGELGFFLGETRSADIITLTPSSFIKIPYSDEINSLIKKEAFQNLRHRFQVLRAFIQSPIFKNIPENTIDEVIFKGKLLQAKPQQLLFNEDDVGSSCYIIVQGQVSIFQQGQFINLLRQGACLGEISLFWSQGRRTAAAIAQNDCLLLEIKQKDFYTILSENIQLGAELETLAFERGQNDLQRKKVA